MNTTVSSGLIPLSDEERAEARAMLDNGSTKAEVAAWIGCELKQLNRVGPAMLPRVFSPEAKEAQAVRDAEILRLRAEHGLSRLKIANRMKLTLGVVCGVLHRNGMTG